MTLKSVGGLAACLPMTSCRPAVVSARTGAPRCGETEKESGSWSSQDERIEP